MNTILVIGETCTDRFVYCRATRLCPEGPVPVLNPVRTTENFGMAANVRANLLSLGAARVDLVCQERDIIKTRYLDDQSGQMVTRVDESDTAAPLDLEWTLSKVREIKWDAIVISDYHKGLLSEDAFCAILDAAHRQRIPTFVDTKKLLGAWSMLARFVKINEREYDAHLRAGLTPESLCEDLIVTRGASGAHWITRGAVSPSESVEVRDLSGAGDTFMAAFVLKWLWNGRNVIAAMEYANRAARVAVSKRGVVAVRADEVE